MLETLAPAERLAFVLHDMFAMPFDEIAPLVDRTPAAARQLASRARRRVQGAAPAPDTDLARQREVVDAFLAASRGGDFEALLAVLDPDVVLRADAGDAPEGVSKLVRGARAVVEAGAHLLPVRRVRPAGAGQRRRRDSSRRRAGGRSPSWASPSRDGKIVEINILADLARLSRLDLTILDD